jgi:hypothetical protein
MTAIRRCEVCSADLSAHRSDAVVCSARCRQALLRRRRQAAAKAEGVTLPPTASGAPPVDRTAADQWEPALWHPVNEPRW